MKCFDDIFPVKVEGEKSVGYTRWVTEVRRVVNVVVVGCGGGLCSVVDGRVSMFSRSTNQLNVSERDWTCCFERGFGWGGEGSK